LGNQNFSTYKKVLEKNFEIEVPAFFLIENLRLCFGRKSWYFLIKTERKRFSLRKMMSKNVLKELWVNESTRVSFIMDGGTIT